MSLPEGGGPNDSSNSGDVVIESWSDADSDVICLDSEVSNNISSQVSEKRLFIKEETAGDSDDCVILEDEIIDAVNQNDQNKKAPGTLDCKSFADFKGFGDQLVTSTPKRRQPQPERVLQEYNTIDELKYDIVDSDSSDDNLEIISDPSPNDVAPNREHEETRGNPYEEDQTLSIKKDEVGVMENTPANLEEKKICAKLDEENNEGTETNNEENNTNIELSDTSTLKRVELVGNDKESYSRVKKRNISEAGPISPQPAKKICFMFGTTGVLDTEKSSSPDKNKEVPLTEQLAMSSEDEEEQVTLEEKGPKALDDEEQEQNGQYWLKMITGSSADLKDDNNCKEIRERKEDTQAWSADEEELADIPVRTKVSRKSIKVPENIVECEAGEENLMNLDCEGLKDENANIDLKDEVANKEDDDADSDDDLHQAIYSLGNYCKRMVRGVMCSKLKCSWVHYMTPEDAVTQFYRICSNRSAKAVLRFYRFFTDLEIQEQMIVDAQELSAKSEPGGNIDIEPKNVCRAVFKAMVKVSKGLDLSMDEYMEMVEISSSLYTIVDGSDTLVSLFTQTSCLVVDAGSHPAGPRLVRWCWTNLYLDSLSHGVVLPSQFFSDVCTLLAHQKMIGQLVTVLLYMALIPSLSPSLVHLAEVLSSPSSVLTTPHSTALSTAQTLSRLCITEWVTLSKMGKIQPGIELLVNLLKDENPIDVHKFFQSLPELPGLDIPDVPPPPLSNQDCWMRAKMAEGKWEDVAYHMCSIDQQDVEVISDFAEQILLEVSQLCGEFRLVEPISVLYNTMVQVVLSRKCEVHTQFIRQLGVALLVCQVTSSQWSEASTIVKILASQLNTDFLCVKVPALPQFSQLDKGMVPLFVLEVLTFTKQRMELVKYLEVWDCLSSLQAELELEKRNKIMTKVLEVLAAGNTDTATVDIMIRISDVMVPGMKTETDVILRKRQEMMSNIVFQLMLNSNMVGSKLWSRYQMVRSCNHQLHKAETRGIVMMLAYNRMLPQAKKVYQEAVKWGVYSLQALSRPLTLRLSSSMVLEEIYVIVVEFLDKLKSEESLNVFVKMEETSTPNTGIKHLNCVRYVAL